MKISKSNYLLLRLWPLVLLFVGCSLLPTPAPTLSPVLTETLPPRPSATPTLTPTPLPGVVTLKLWVPDFLNPQDEESGAALLNAQLEGFREIHPDVQVKVTVKKAEGEGGLYNLLSAAYTAAPSVVPDVIVLKQSDLRRAVVAKLAQPFDNTLAPTQDFYPFAQEVWDGEHSYGIPLLAQADQMAYRQGIARTPPLTWTDVLTSGYSMLFPAAPLDGLASDSLVSAYLGVGGTAVDPETNQIVLERAALERLYGFFAEMMARNLINPDRVLALPDTSACWESYQEGIGRMSPVSAGVYWMDPPPGSLPGWMPTPDGHVVALAHTWSIGLISTDEFRQQKALQLMQWLTAPEQVAELARATGHLPARQRAIELWGLLPEEVSFLDAFLSHATPSLPPDADLAVRRALQAGLSALLKGEVEGPETAATHALSNFR